MGKRRRTPSRFSIDDSQVDSTNSGSTIRNCALAVFDFDEFDLDVETISRKSVEKYREKNPGKRRRAHGRSVPVEKYEFLEFGVACGSKDRQNDQWNNVLDVDPPHSVSHQQSKYTCEAIKRERGTQVMHRTAKKDIKPLTPDFEENSIIDLGSPASSIDPTDKEGLLKENGTKDDCEPVVIVNPNYAKYDHVYYTRCMLAFSRMCVRLLGSPLRDREKRQCCEWSTSDILKIEYLQDKSVKAGVVNLHFKSKGTNDGSKDKTNNSGVVELEFLFDDPEWCNRLEEIKSLDKKYAAVSRTIKSDWNFRNSCGDIIFPDGDPDAVVVSANDIELLQPRTFINDTIIDFYIKYLVNRIKPEQQHRFHFFNTFFFQKLVDMDLDFSRPCEGRDAFQRVRKWTKKVNIFEKDYVFIPINFSLHWSLIVICYPGKIADLKGIDMDDSSNIPCILHMNSISGSHKGLEKHIRSYLWKEWEESQNELAKDASMKFKNLDFIALQLPQQENFFDCGLFLLHYAELFLDQASNFSTKKYLDVLNEDWFHPAEVTLTKRNHIRKLIQKIAEDSSSLRHSADNVDDNQFLTCKSMGTSSVQSAREKDSNESCVDIRYISDDEQQQIEGQKSLVGMVENIHMSVPDENYETHKKLLPADEFGGREMAVEAEHPTQSNFSSRDGTSRYELNGDMSLGGVRCLFKREEMNVPHGASKVRSGDLRVIIDLHNEEFGAEKETERCENSPVLTEEDVALCVVEDSEDECGVECVSSRDGTCRYKLNEENVSSIRNFCTRMGTERWDNSTIFSKEEGLAFCVVEDSEEC